MQYNSIQFEYETRSDIQLGFISGSSSKVTKRLTSINTYVEQAVVRNYLISYENVGPANLSRIVEIEELVKQFYDDINNLPPNLQEEYKVYQKFLNKEVETFIATFSSNLKTLVWVNSY